MEAIWSLSIVECSLIHAWVYWNVSQFSFLAAYVLGKTKYMGDHPSLALVVMIWWLLNNFRQKVELR
jgi:hypothetical protein